MHTVVQSRMETISMIGSCGELQWKCVKWKHDYAQCCRSLVRNNTHQFTWSSPTKN